MRFAMKTLAAALCALLLASCALAEALPEQTAEPEAPAPAGTPLPEGELHLDFAQLEPDNPLATPVAVDPIDKPTPTPNPTPNFWYDNFSSSEMGVSFNVPGTWLLNPNTNQSTTLQFVEPQSEMMDVGGYQTRVTVEKVDMGLEQNSDDARERLQQTLTELGQTFTNFTPNDIAQQSFGDYRGYYCYYRAEYNDGAKNYEMNGRIIVFASGHALYQVRLTAPRRWYSYYEYVYRNIRNSFKVL